MIVYLGKSYAPLSYTFEEAELRSALTNQVPKIVFVPAFAGLHYLDKQRHLLP